MPQMMPMCWILVFTFMMKMILTFMSMQYFQYPPFNNNSNNKTIKFINFNLNNKDF